MQAVQVSGRFVTKDREPVEGSVAFIPDKIWLDDEDGLCYPTLAPEVRLVDGRFSVMLTRTDQYTYPWSYTVVCPVGRWTIDVDQNGPLLLKALLPRAAQPDVTNP